ncbi:MAG TPA: AAA family ATPase [Gemmatimonadaceae bacterium]|nr:AAA family ATPase [Gemmatimonadaceae bacterium]
MTHRGITTLKPFPLVGRTGELALLGDWIGDAAGGHGGLHMIAGPSGIGKTRIAKAIADRAERDRWSVAIGRVYSVESGVPYAVWSDALTHLLSALDASTRSVLTRGGDWIGTICPAFARDAASDDADGQRDGKARLLWNCSQFLARLAEKQPLLLVLENLHVADSASLELLHFVARQIGRARIAIIGTYTETELDRNVALLEMEQSLLALGSAKLLRLGALSQEAVEQLVCDAFDVEHPSARQLARRLYSWTRGHPFFIEEMLKSLVAAGRLYERGGTWLGWEVEELDLPRSVRSAVSKRLEQLSADARGVAGAAAVIGARLRFGILATVCELPRDAVLAAIDELCRAGVLVEAQRSEEGDYEIAHPMLQDVIYDSLGVARTRLLHAAVARAFEASFGENAQAHADVLAFHFSRAEPESDEGKAALYLAAAGRDALARHADRAAADYLSAALARHADPDDAEMLVDDLAQARQRLGDYDGAMGLWQRARIEAQSRGNHLRCARVERRMGLACYWSGRFEEALAHFDAAEVSAQAAQDDVMRAQIQVNRGTCWQSLGRVHDAERDLSAARLAAERLGDRALLARAHRGLLFLYTFLGPPETARAHGEQAESIGEDIGDRSVVWSAHYGLATLAGLTGDSSALLHHVQRAEQLADELQSPLLRIYIDEISIEYAFGSGAWDAGIALAERTIAVARALNQKTLLPRVLVWATHFYTARGEYERAKQYLDEAWELGVARGARGRPIEIHSQVPVYAGFANYYLAVGDYARAVEIGQQGIAIADRSGYVAWAIHRLIPATAEAAFWKRDMEVAIALRDRMKEECERMGHRLGLVWVAAGDGIIARLREDYTTSEQLLRSAIDGLEAIPWVFDAARLRRWLADVMIRLGDQQGGVRELRRSHDVCAALGARIEMERARDMMKELGLRPPSREMAGGKRMASLTARESDIARLVAARKSNKEIAAELGIAARTVTTHVANIFTKLGVSSRGELADRVRDGTVATAV